MSTGWWLLALAAAFGGPDKDEDDPRPRITTYDFGAIEVTGDLVQPSGFGATPGGAQDIAYFRDRVLAGEVPLPEVFTPEGLFSEHDLPLEPRPCDRLLCTNVAAVKADLLVQTDVVALAQIGFDSGLDPASFRRAPVNLVAVIDKSCSMEGEPIETVKASLRAVVDKLGPKDQLSLVLYGATVHTHLAPTSATDRGKLDAAIDAITINGSTNLEAGLTHGFAVARASRQRFDGTTRVMLFTDERPNTGRTDTQSFMALAENASRDGIGMTTVGVAVHFGAEMAQQVSAIRGGNLVYFATTQDMRARLPEDFDFLVTELAYDLDVVVRPAPGLTIAGLYGVPGSLVHWDDNGAVGFRVSTIFLSRNNGAIYAALAEAPGGASVEEGKDVANVTLSYTPRDGTRDTESRGVALVSLQKAPLGLVRGWILVDEATTLAAAAIRHHHHNDQDGAWRLVHDLRGRLDTSRDTTLEEERTLVANLEQTLGALAGRVGEPTTPRRDPITGLPGPPGSRHTLR